MKQLIQSIKDYAIPLRTANDYDFLLNTVNEQSLVLLGESSHGTSEYYKERAEISKKLITEKGFTFLAVEGDWPACQKVNRYIKGFDEKFKDAREVLKSFNRWPTWMWANEEMIELIEWLKEHNMKQLKEKQVGFYGIDIYSLWESMDEIISYLEKTNSSLVEEAKQTFSCFDPFNRKPEKYGISAAFYSEGCHEEVTKLLTEISLNKHTFKDNEESSLNIEINALITANAENYYRTMVLDDNQSWNIRDQHMVEVIHKIEQFHGEKAKGIVWEHNTHVGDARATDMANQGVVNVGQLLREQKGNNKVLIVGFGTHRGTVIAADQWGVNLENMITPPAQEGSWEDAMHKAGPSNKLLLFTQENRYLFSQPIGHRAIGVVYNPQYEQYGNYVPSVMSDRYDAFVYINNSKALQPLDVKEVFL
ncbi:erythromycin esterase-like protein [Metabacillus crassostreae]|uniref:erythromycin esterase family protein n=1 Tax=Metabacillus crassostreae TaxID=929098 RepID=UPI00195E9300|nr:erythromycin esterase family protein [Metabacillus crassostreae]MBM7603750.1 erythromycin esterase-like protein [Metabacillus crassostreae]